MNQEINKRIFINNKPTNYLITNTGKVYSENSKKYLIPEIRSGYLSINIYTINGPTHCTIHRLVATAYIPNPSNKPQVNHIDGNKKNNVVSNLEWVTASENSIHAFKNHLRSNKEGEASHLCRYSDKQLKKIFKLLNKGLTNAEIEKITGISFGYISAIRHNGFHRAKNHYKKLDFNYSERVVSMEIRKKIKQLIEKGKSNDEIRVKLNLKNSKQIQDLFHRLRKKFQVQRLSKGPMHIRCGF